MKNKWFLLCAVLGLLSQKGFSQENSDYSSYGTGPEPQEVMSSEQVETAYKNLQPGDTLQLAFKARVASVCKKKGCWMNLQLPQKQEVMVKFKNYAFFVPKDIEDREVIVNGKAYVEVMSAEDRRHYAEDAGKTTEEIESIVGPKQSLLFKADRVLVKQERKSEKK